MNAEDVTYTSVVMSRSGKVLFAGTSTGTVRAIKYPLSLQKEWIEYQAHASAVTKVCHHNNHAHECGITQNVKGTICIYL